MAKENWLKRHAVWLKQSVRDFGKADPLILGSSIAFFTVFALPGVLMILVEVANTFFDSEEIHDALVEQASGLVGERMGEYLKDVLEDAGIEKSSLLKRVFGIAAIVISGTMAFVSLQRGLDRIWGVEIQEGQGLKQQLITRGIALLIMAGMSLLLPVSLLFDNVIVFLFRELGLANVLPDAAFGVAGQFTSLLLMFVVMLVLFKVVPNAKIQWKDVIPGAVVGSLLFMLGRYLIGLYVEQTKVGEAFGAGQTVLVVLVWMFISALILLFGAFHCHTVAEGRGHGIDPGRQAKAVDGVGNRN